MLIRTALTLLLLLPATVTAQDLDIAISAVVRISGTRGGTPVRGSGFVVGLDHDKATIVTASHVIEGAQQIEVTFAVDPAVSFPAGNVRMESGNRRGLAMFQVRGALPAGVTALSFDTEAQLQRGEDLFLLGFPQMAMSPLTLRRTFAGPDGNFLQLDQPVGEGFSGAPVLRRGKVVGVVMDEDPQITFAVKALVARDAVIGWEGKLGGLSGTQVPIPATPAPPASKPCVPGEELTENDITYVRICGGTFTMGSANDPLAKADEKPAHQVTLSEFWIGKTEITNKQYSRFRPDHQGEASLPVTEVSWTDAQAACEHFGDRLPTEAEWEYAARASSRATWAFGDDEKMLGEYAWYSENSGKTPHPVGTKKPNAWGLHDMHGNVGEWVADWYGTYPSVAQTDPSGPAAGENRVLRGGTFNYSPWDLRSAIRGRFLPSFRYWNVGFRCARSPGQRNTDVISTAPQVKPAPPALTTCVPGEERTEAGIVFVRICAGTFTMGSAKNDPLAWENEKPAHQVILSEFWLGKTEITNEQFGSFRSDHTGEAKLPAADVSWTDAQAACEHFGGRLPTEAEWEYAARAGSQAPWSFGNDEKTLAEYAWFGESSSTTPHPVEMKKANTWGLYDMHGNVWEWVADWYAPYTSEPQGDPTGPKSGVFRVLRGGAFLDSPRYLRSAIRDWDRPSDRFRFIGFRCARSPRRQL